jgi:sugar/nucleoside kinase (ribokinase family)
VGKDSFGDLVKTSLEAKGVDTRYIMDGPTPTGATICMNYGEDRANLTYQGSMDVMGWDDINKEVFDNTRHIHLSSLFMQNALLRDIHKVLDAAKEKGITVSLDTQWDPMETWKLDYRSVLPKITIFMPNEKELQALTHKDSLEGAIAEVLPFLGNAMVVKCGSKGSLLVRKDGNMKLLPAFLNSDVVDAIGAGDSFNSGFISAFVKGLSLEDCQETGNLTGAVNTTGAGGTGAFTSLEHVREVCLGRFAKEIKL